MTIASFFFRKRKILLFKPGRNLLIKANYYNFKMINLLKKSVKNYKKSKIGFKLTNLESFIK